MSTPRRGLVIFDLDGTLFRTDICSVRALEAVFRDHGLGAPAKDEWIGLFGRPDEDFVSWLDQRAGAGRGRPLLDEIAQRELVLVPKDGRLFDGVGEALAALRSRVEQMAICSNGPKEYVLTVLAATGIAGCFDAVRWRKPQDDSKAEMVGELLAALPARPAVMVGDRKEDVEAARANGIAALGAGYGYGRTAELGEACAVVTSAGQLPQAIEALLRD